MEELYKLSSDKFKSGLFKTKKSFSDKLKDVFLKNKIDEDVYEDLIEILITSDIPYHLSEEIIENARKIATKEDIVAPEKLHPIILNEIDKKLKENVWDEKIKKPAIILFIGVNGAGKTTTIAKLGNKLKEEGSSVLLAAGDTFRAAACEQLATWASRIDVPIVKSSEGQDPASVVYDAIHSGKAKNCDVILIDTAGRLQTKTNLMNELNKIYRVCEKEKEEYNLYTLLVLDAGAGQNSVIQAKSFCENAKVDGLIMTKLDGSSKGGVIIALSGKETPPMWYVGLGEGLDDLEVFDKEKYLSAIFDK